MFRYLCPIMSLIACTPYAGDSLSEFDGYSSGYESTSSSSSSSGENIEAGTLTAGTWNDIDNWDFWLELIDNPESSYFDQPNDWGFSLNQRLEIMLLDGEKPAVDTSVHMYDANGAQVWQSRTNNRGIAQLYPNIFEDQIGPFSIEIETQAGMIAYNEYLSLPVNKSLAMEVEALPAENIVDLMFVIDTTSSMCDELRYLQTELRYVINESKASFNTNSILRSSVNFYRDEGDAYVTRSFPFSEDIDDVVSHLDAQGCRGGGDYPEAVGAALEDAIQGHDWSPSAQARLLFLVLDAPPHQNEETLLSIQNSIEMAAEKGIQIIPIASSGIDKSTEFFLRSIDIATHGTYVFLTDHSGVGGAHLEASVGEFDVRPLNELLVELIQEASVVE